MKSVGAVREMDKSGRPLVPSKALFVTLWIDPHFLLKCCFFSQIVGVDYVYFIQKNSLDRRKRTLRIEAHNESFSSKIIINEHCYYSVRVFNVYVHSVCRHTMRSTVLKSKFWSELRLFQLLLRSARSLRRESTEMCDV